MVRIKVVCPHEPRCYVWESRGRHIAVCQMAPQHLDLCIEMLIESMAKIVYYDGRLATIRPSYVEAEGKLQTLNKERERRQHESRRKRRA
jgi:hypothetical protein